jgi:hypothetical protein
MWSNSHELFLNSIYALVKHKDFINIIFSPILFNHVDLTQLSSQIHISFVISILSQYLEILKLLTNTFQLFVLLIVIEWFVYVLLFLCYSLCEELRD